MIEIVDVDIDQLVDYEAEYSIYVKKPHISGNNLTGLCPFHDDRNNSFSVDLQTGKWHCHAENIGGNFITFYAKIHEMNTKEAYNQILEKYNVTPKKSMKNRLSSYSLAQYATEKHLPKEWLKERCKLSTEKDRNGTTYLKLPYFTEDNRELTFRKRYAYKNFRWKWGSAGKIGLYGEWRIKEIREEGYVLLVEGESDTQSLWYMKIPAIGVPGASMFQTRHVPLLQNLKMYIHEEKDKGGETFLKKTLEELRKENFSGEVYRFSCGSIEKCKDPSDVLIQFGQENGGKQIMKLVQSAEKIDLDTLEVIPEMIKGAPIDLRVPDGWKYDKKGIWHVNEKTYELNLVCRTPLILTQRLKNIETEEEKIEVAFERDGIWHKAIFPRSVIFTAKSITILADSGCTITSENAKQIVRFLSALEAENIDLIKRVDSTSTFGWQTNGRFIPGIEDDMILDIDPNQKAIAAAYNQVGSIEGWLATMRPHREKYKFRFILAAAFATPLLRIIKQRIFFVYNWGGSRSGKTAALKAALSAWGNPDGLMMNFNATQVGLERIASFFCDLPLGIDERQLSGRNQENLEKIVYMIASGVGRIRGAKSGGIQNVNTWRTIALATGEEPLSTDTSQTGVSTRVLEIYCGPFEKESDAAQMYQDVNINHGQAGPEFVRHLIEVSEDSIREWYAKMQEFVKSISSGKVGSHVASVAVIALADAMLDEWFFNSEHKKLPTKTLQISQKSWDDACTMAQKIIEEQMSAATSDVNENAVQFLIDWILSNQSYFGEDVIGTCFGTMSGDNKVAYIYPSHLNAILKKEGFNDRKTKKYMADKGIITTGKRNDHKGEIYSVIKWFNGRNQRFVEFFLDKALENEDKVQKSEDKVQKMEEEVAEKKRNILPMQEEQNEWKLLSKGEKTPF